MTSVRHPRAGEEEALMRLWETVYGESEEIIRSFFRTLYAPERAYVVEEDGRIVSAAHVILFGEARYIYAVATHPDYRGHGCGKAVTLAAAEGGFAYLCPANDGLRAWYAREMGAVTVSYRSKHSMPALLSPLTAEEYSARREALLSGVSHATYSPAILRFFTEYGGEFYETKDGICAVEDGAVRELLPCDDGTEPFIMGLNGAPSLYWGLVLE